jgi:hypothetical protein
LTFIVRSNSEQTRFRYPAIQCVRWSSTEMPRSWGCFLPELYEVVAHSRVSFLAPHWFSLQLRDILFFSSMLPSWREFWNCFKGAANYGDVNKPPRAGNEPYLASFAGLNSPYPPQLTSIIDKTTPLTSDCVQVNILVVVFIRSNLEHTTQTPAHELPLSVYEDPFSLHPKIRLLSSQKAQVHPFFKFLSPYVDTKITIDSASNSLPPTVCFASFGCLSFRLLWTTIHKPTNNIVRSVREIVVTQYIQKLCVVIPKRSWTSRREAWRRSSVQVSVGIPHRFECSGW